MNYFGRRYTGSTVRIPFSTFNASMGSVTISGLATSDIKVYKGSSMTQRSSTSGFSLIDTDGIDLDGIVGLHGIALDLSDNTDSGFYAADNQYFVVLDNIVVNGQTVSPMIATFDIVEAPSTLEEVIDGIWNAVLGDYAISGSTGEALSLAATAANVPSASDIATAVWGAATRLLTAGTNIVLAKGTGVTGFTDLDAAGVRTAVGLGSANLDTQLGTIDGNVDTTLAGVVTIDGKIDTIDGIVDAILADTAEIANISDAIGERLLDGAITWEEALRGMAAVLLGKASGLATTTATYRDLNDTKDRVIATVDGDGNRSAVTRDLS